MWHIVKQDIEESDGERFTVVQHTSEPMSAALASRNGVVLCIDSYQLGRLRASIKDPSQDVIDVVAPNSLGLRAKGVGPLRRLLRALLCD